MPPHLEQRLDEFVDAHVNSFIKWDLLVFFHENPGSTGTPVAIATRLGRRSDEVSSAMADLADSGILHRIPGEDSVFGFAAEGVKAPLVTEFIAALDSREHRLQILTKLLRLGARG